MPALWPYPYFLPPGYKEGSLALGATHFETIWHVMLPATIGPIVTGVILAAGRGFGEAAALLYTAGMSTDINWNNWNRKCKNYSKSKGLILLH